MSTQEYKIIIQRQEVKIRFYEELLDEAVTLEMVVIPGGRFMMGAPKNELGYKDMDGPEHEVTVPSFSLGAYPVTQAQWSVVANWQKVKRDLDTDPSYFKGLDRPVENVSWYDAAEFCARLSYRTERRYRLPTEAEWEYSCRAGTTTPFHFGETITTDLANYRGKARERKGKVLLGHYGRGPQGVFRNETTPIHFFDLANAYGLCDMHGNVFEWCEDKWHHNYRRAPNNGSAWLDEGSKAHVARGGSHVDRPSSCRSAFRMHFSADMKERKIGFRVACAAPTVI